MNRDMVRRWNERVSTPDTVYHLGDFALGDPAMYPAYRKQLNGSIIPVRGNHDARMESVISEIGFADVLDNAIVEVDGVRLWLNHYPLGIPDHRGRPLVRPRSPGPYDIVLCGHVHQQFKIRNGNVNVGVDVWNFTPISLDDIITALACD